MLRGGGHGGGSWPAVGGAAVVVRAALVCAATAMRAWRSFLFGAAEVCR